MKHIFRTLLLCSVILGSSCSNDDDAMIVENASSILDKWYYDSNGVTADIYFDSNGSHQQRIEALGQVFTSQGDWSWIDESTGMMKIENLSGQVQLVDEAWFRFTNITATTFSLEQSTDGGESYSTAINYQDTDPNG